MARRGEIPPYEIMRQRGRSAPASEPAGDGPAEDAGPRGGGWSGAQGSRGPAGWVASVKEQWGVPVVLRVPRGLVAVALVGLLGLLVLAYWVGASRGRGAAEAAHREQAASGVGVPGPRGVGNISISRPEDPPAGRAGNGSNGGSGTDPGPSDGPSAQGGPQPVEPTYAERREPGLNYFRLVYTSTEEAEQIAQFMANARIDIQLVLVNNGRSCIVYAVDRGFRSDQLGSDARRQHERHLRALGNQWRALGSGHSNFNTMIPERYEGPDAD